jgi:hypothetical protein
MWWGVRRGLATAAVVGLACAACTSGSPPPEPEPALGPVPRVTSGADLVLPLDAYILNQGEYVAVQRAVWRLTGGCVRRFGGRYTASEASFTSDVPQLDNLNERRYGLLSAASAARFGYDWPGRGDREKDRSSGWDPTPNEKFLVVGATGDFAVVKNLPADAEGRRLRPDGCAGEAWRALASGSPERVDLELADNLRGQLNDRSKEDSRVRAAMSQWSACMAASGYTYATIWEPNNTDWPAPPGPEEIATARADVACKERTNLAGIWFAVETAYQRRAIERYAEPLKALQEYVRAQARNAARVLAGG